VRLVLQRVSRARVTVGEKEVSQIGPGWAILVGVGRDDDEATVSRMVDKIVKLRGFEDAQGKMNLAAADVGAEFLIVSQFTLYANLAGGRRPSFIQAAPPEQAEPLVQRFADLVRARGFRVATGRFGASMDLDLLNRGPVTFALSTDGW
jgi:D-tyrosyl-tRNA(Tyr) deacylase